MGVPAWYSPYSYSLLLATSTDLFFHRTHAKVPPRPLFLGSSTGIPHCVPRVWLLMLLKCWNSHFPHCQSHVCFHPWTLAELLGPPCVLLKELLYLVEWPLFHNSETTSWFQTMPAFPVPCLWPQAPRGSALHEVQRLCKSGKQWLLGLTLCSISYAPIRVNRIGLCDSSTPPPSPKCLSHSFHIPFEHAGYIES